MYNSTKNPKTQKLGLLNKIDHQDEVFNVPTQENVSTTPKSSYSIEIDPNK
jgi:hypothetical protein